MSRTVSVVLIDRGGALRGVLDPFEVEVPWWPEVGEIVATVRQRHGLEITVLRLLTTDRPAQPGGAVSYLAEADAGQVYPAGLPLPDLDLAPHPLRAAYAEPGGPAVSLAWASDTLSRIGWGAPTVVNQRKTWNLSALWRLQCPAGVVWLKQTPGFFFPESTVLTWLAQTLPGVAPQLLAADRHGRTLLAEAPGQDRFGAPAVEREPMAQRLHEVQLQALTKLDHLAGLGVPDWREDRLVELAEEIADRHGAGIRGLPELLRALPGRLARIRDCGVPDTLVHSDFHPGNVRTVDGPDPALTILDWGEVFLGHPGLDILRLTGDLAPAARQPLLREWSRRWALAAPGCDPDRALTLLPPVEALRGAVVYGTFLANIEPSEHPYHAQDVPDCLRRAVELAGVA